MNPNTLAALGAGAFVAFIASVIMWMNLDSERRKFARDYTCIDFARDGVTCDLWQRNARYNPENVE